MNLTTNYQFMLMMKILHNLHKCLVDSGKKCTEYNLINNLISSPPICCEHGGQDIDQNNAYTIPIF